MGKMLVYSDLQGLTVPKRHTAYAEAYRHAAETSCQEMLTNVRTRTWPTASVVLMLTAHAVEIFLKGAICYRNPGAELWGHDIARLEKEYKTLFPEPDFDWDVLFKTETHGFSDEESQLLKSSIPHPSILYRYPVKNGLEYEAALGFTPETMLLALQRLKADFSRIEAQLVD